jgi:hypothetical protein
LNCGIGFSSLNADVKTFDRLQIVRDQLQGSTRDRRSDRRPTTALGILLRREKELIDRGDALTALARYGRSIRDMATSSIGHPFIPTPVPNEEIERLTKNSILTNTFLTLYVRL